MPDLFVFDLDLTLWQCGRMLWCDDRITLRGMPGS